jgi:hypothetical protein
MCVDCVHASPRITQVDHGDESLPEVVLSQPHRRVLVPYRRELDCAAVNVGAGCLMGALPRSPVRELRPRITAR